jgi:hypothetical protein
MNSPGRARYFDQLQQNKQNPSREAVNYDQKLKRSVNKLISAGNIYRFTIRKCLSRFVSVLKRVYSFCSSKKGKLMIFVS